MIQGITGTHGAFHTRAMCDAGTNIVCGVTPGKAGQQVHGIPVFNSVAEARENHDVSISVVFVPAPYAKDALIEAIKAGIKLIVCITEGIPIHDMLAVLWAAREQEVQIIGPNCPGILVPDVIKLGIIPAAVGTPGNVALVSRSGTLTYEAAASLTAAGIGQRIIVGIGGDPLIGTSFVDCLKSFKQDPNVEKMVLIGEIGGQDEQLAAEYIKSNITEPVFAYIVGHSAPHQTKLGHAGAIMVGTDESAAAKTKALYNAGAVTADSLPELVARIVAS
jgi:succinyl-CoA synthetase alpha subunit